MYINPPINEKNKVILMLSGFQVWLGKYYLISAEGLCILSYIQPNPLPKDLL